MAHSPVRARSSIHATAPAPSSGPARTSPAATGAPSRWTVGMDLVVGGRRPARASRPGPVGSTRPRWCSPRRCRRRRRGRARGRPDGPGGRRRRSRAGASRRRRRAGAHRRGGCARWRPPRSAPRTAGPRPPPPPGASGPAARAVPKRARGSAPRTTVAHSGTGATARPCCSRTRHSSVRPRPEPPCSSGTARPRRLALASSDHRAASKRSSVSSISATRSASAMPWKIGRRGLRHRLLLLGEGEVHQAALARRTERAGTWES